MSKGKRRLGASEGGPIDEWGCTGRKGKLSSCGQISHLGKRGSNTPLQEDCGRSKESGSKGACIGMCKPRGS
eukprot:scaffold2193_cov171-Amphora_coffeaeformis.AAC.2